MSLIFTCIFIFSCKEDAGVDVVEGNETEALPEAVVTFDYQKVEGDFNGKINGKPVTLTLDSGTDYTLNYNGKEYEGKYFFINEGSIIQLEYKKNQTSLPFAYLKLEDPSYVAILDSNQNPTEFYLEQTKK